MVLDGPSEGKVGPPTHLNQSLDPFLDVSWIGQEARCQLASSLVDQVNVRHVLAVLHNPYNACLCA